MPTVESMTDQLECLWPLSLVVTAMVLTEEAVRFSGLLPVAANPRVCFMTDLAGVLTKGVGGS